MYPVRLFYLRLVNVCAVHLHLFCIMCHGLYVHLDPFARWILTSFKSIYVHFENGL